MDKLVTIRLELACKDATGKLYTTRACENAGFPYGSYLVGIRDVDGESE